MNGILYICTKIKEFHLSSYLINIKRIMIQSSVNNKGNSKFFELMLMWLLKMNQLIHHWYAPLSRESASLTFPFTRRGLRRSKQKLLLCSVETKPVVWTLCWTYLSVHEHKQSSPHTKILLIFVHRSNVSKVYKLNIYLLIFKTSAVIIL